MANGNIDFVDKTGKLVNITDINEAIKAVEKQIVTGMDKLPPSFFIQLTTIHRGLKELLMFRNLLNSLKKGQA